MLKRKSRSIAALTSAVLFINAGICTFTASADSSAVFTSNEEYSLYIDHLPTKTVYQIGEELDITGTKIYGSYTDGELVGDIFSTDLAPYLENGMMTLDDSEFDNTKAGIYTIYIHYGTATSSFEVIVEEENYSIYIYEPPTKTVYQIGEELDITGTKIYGSYTDGELVGDIFPTDLAPYLENGMMTLDDSEFDNTKAGTYTIYIHYGTATASFEVTVIDEETDLPDELTLHCYPYRLDFDLNMELDLSGAIISGSYGEKGECYEFHGEYLTDMIEKGIVEVDASAYNSSEIGTYTIYVKLGTVVESFDVRVGCPLVQNILEIKALPDKTVYNYGEELDLTGAEVYCWARGDGGTIPDAEFTADLQTLVDNETIKIDYSEFYATESGTCTIYLNYGHAWASFDVTVTDEAVIEENAVMTVEITEIDGDTLFVRQSGNSGDLMTLSAKYLDSNIQPTIGMKLEVTYCYILETYPAKFGNIKKVSAISDYTSVAGDANGDGDFTIADMVTVQRSIMGRKTAILSDYKAADLYEDGKIDVYDFILMRKNIVEKTK